MWSLHTLQGPKQQQTEALCLVLLASTLHVACMLQSDNVIMQSMHVGNVYFRALHCPSGSCQISTPVCTTCRQQAKIVSVNHHTLMFNVPYFKILTYCVSSIGANVWLISKFALHLKDSYSQILRIVYYVFRIEYYVW